MRRRKRPPIHPSRGPLGTVRPLHWRQRWLRRFLDLPPPWLERLGGGAVRIDDQRLDPRLVPLCRQAAKETPLSELEPESARRVLAKRTWLLGGPRLLMDRVEEHAIPRPGDASGRPSRVRVYSPPTLLPDPPALVYFHGGGWVLGDLESHDTLCSILASQTPCRVVAVDYRRAPEHPFPAAVDDALQAFDWVARHARELGIDRQRIAVGGDSAGGHLAAVLCQACSRRPAGDDEAPRPAAQMLLYPVTDSARDTPSYRLFARGFGLERETMDWFFRHFAPALDREGGPSGDDPRISPLRVEDASGLPPALVVTAGFDVLRDEGRAYARRLQEAGVAVVHRQFDGLIHGFANMALVEPCRHALDEVVSELALLFRRLADGRKNAS